jgi:hypothetical protein
MDEEILEKLGEVRDLMLKAKPQDRSELARRYAAISITELEKLIGYFDTFVCEQLYWPEND